MKLDLPSMLTASIDIVYPEPMNWADPTIKGTHFVVAHFGSVEVGRWKFTDEQERSVDHYSQHHDQEMQEIADQVVAEQLRALFASLTKVD